MEKTPKGKSLKFVRPTEHENAVFPRSHTIVEDNKRQKRVWESDFCSQETDADVEWDWNSPKNIKPKIQRIHKRQILKSPETVPKKQHVNSSKNYEKLREELQALRDEIAKVDDDCFHASPLDEQAVKNETARDYDDIDSFIEEQYFHIESLVDDSCKKLENESHKTKPPNVHINTVNEMLNDSWDEELLKCTQMLEEKLHQEAAMTNPKEISNKDLPVKANSTRTLEFKTGSSKNMEECRMHDQLQSADDSFDAVLREFKDEDIDILSQTVNKSFVPKKFVNNNSSTFKRTFSDANVQYVPKKDRVVKVSKFVFHRTHSFESATTSQEEDIPRHLMEEIERKRKEALAKLKQKKEKPPPAKNDDCYIISPMKCSPEEIEQKRLHAKAIREAKQKEIMEKNRQEALKRLEMNRLKKLGAKKFLN